VDNPFAVVHFFHIIYLMSFLNKLASWPVFTLLLLILLTVPNIGLTATASLSHDGGSIWKVGGSNVNFNWTTNTDPTKRIIILTSKTQDPVLSHALGTPSGAILDTNANWFNNDNNNIYNPSPRTNAAKTGSFSWKVQSRYIKSGDPLSYPFYVRVLTLRNNIHPHNTVDTASSWLGPYRILRADACSLTTQVTGNGTITPATNTVWSNGQTKTVTFTPNAGHRIATAVFPQPYGVRPSACIETNGGACIPVATSGTGTLTKTLSCTTGAQYKAKVTFEAIPSCPVPSQIVGTGGKVTLVPAAPVTTVASGQTLKVTATANAGYKIKEFKLRGYDSWFTMSDATGKASSTQTLSCPAGQTKKLGYDVGFELANTYKIISSRIGAGGNITPEGEIILTKDKSKIYAVTPLSGYAIEELKIDGVLQSAYTARTTTANITLSYINETKNPRTISVKFAPACKFVTPSKTLDNIKKGNQTYINRDNFRTWVGENRALVEDEFNNYQCAYLEQSTDESTASALMRSSILGDFTRAKDLNKPVLGSLFLVGDNSNNAGHAVVVTGFTSAVAFNPPRTVYSINYIDPNGPAAGTLTCRSEYVAVVPGSTERQHIITCNIPSNYSVHNEWTVRRLYLISPVYTDTVNSTLINMSAFRTNPTSWLSNNYTLIDNYGSDESPEGVCLGWSEFNARAAQLVKECVAPPLSLPKTSFNTKEEISFLNKVAVKETITDKYLAQLALLWQIDDVVMGWWEKVVN